MRRQCVPEDAGLCGAEIFPWALCSPSHSSPDVRGAGALWRGFPMQEALPLAGGAALSPTPC